MCDCELMGIFPVVRGKDEKLGCIVRVVGTNDVPSRGHLEVDFVIVTGNVEGTLWIGI